MKESEIPDALLGGLICGGLSAAMFRLSTGLGDVWLLAWFAPAPLLWLGYGRTPAWIVAIAALLAFTIGQMGFLEAFAGLRTASRMVMLAIVLSAALFAAAVLIGRLAQRRLHPALAIGAFPAAWTGVEYLVSRLSPNGTVGALAYTQVGAPMLIQGASLFGLWFVTFLLCLVASSLALGVRERHHRLILLGISLAVFAANTAFGAARLLEPRGPTVRIAVAAKDLIGPGHPSGRETWVGLATEYGDLAKTLAAKGATTVVLPEKLAVLKPEWRDAVLEPLKNAARSAKIRIVAGFDDDGAVRRNIALIFWPNGEVSTYVKRKLILGLDHGVTPGDQAGSLGGGEGVVICKDMDFPAMIRRDGQTGVRLMYVPAEDFVVDHWMHERMAAMRGVENGFSVARAARKGDLMITDPQGRVLALASSSSAMASRVADVPLGTGGTLYSRIGDVFAWACLLATFLLFAAALVAPRRQADGG
jgi:apolipoprotein N-acyltransferase